MDRPRRSPLETSRATPLSSSDSESARTTLLKAPSRAAGINVEAAPGPEQLKLERVAQLCIFQQFKLRTLVSWSRRRQIHRIM
eukprot:10934794-Alexandrium_andersonii.AAC.1